MNDLKIESMKVFYDNHNEKFLQALVVTSDGKKEVIKSSAKIEKRITELAKQHGVKKVAELPSSVFECAFKYKDGKINPVAADWAKKTITTSQINLNRTSPYNGKSTEEIQEAKSSSSKKTIFAAGMVIGAVILTATGCAIFNKDKKEEVVETNIQTEVSKKEAPTSWEQYVSEYEKSNQKEYLVATMNENIIPNINEVNYMEEEKFQYALSADEAVCLGLYADIYHYSEEGNNNNNWDDFYAIVGDYSISEIKANAKNALLKITSSITLAEKKDDVLVYNFKDEVTNRLFDEYIDLILKHKKETNNKKKKEVQEEIKDKLIRNFINRQEGKDEYVGFEENAEAYFVILNTITPACGSSSVGIDIPNDISAKLNGKEANYDKEGNQITESENGYADRFCTQADNLLEEFDAYRKEKNEEVREVNIANQTNIQFIDNYVPIKSSKEQILENAYDLEHMINIMNDYIVAEYDFASVEELQDVTRIVNYANEYLDYQFKSQEFSSKNPYGGKKGDSYKEQTVVAQPITPEQVQESFTEEEIKEAQQEAQQEAAKDGVISLEQFQQEEEKLNNETVTDDYGNQGTISTDYTAITWSVYHYFTGESNGHTIISYDASWETSSDDLTRAAYNLGKQRADEYHAALNQASQDNTTGNVEDIYGDNYAGEHSQNPNQNGVENTENNNATVEPPKQEENTTQNEDVNNENNSAKEEETKQEENTTNSNNNITSSSTTTTNGADQTPHTSQNPYQNGTINTETASATVEQPAQEESPSIAADSTVTTNGADQTPTSNENPNQNNTVKSEEESTTIATTTEDIIFGSSDILGEVTTDATGVEDMSQYGDYSGYSLYDVYSIIEEYENSSIQEEPGYQKTK